MKLPALYALITVCCVFAPATYIGPAPSDAADLLPLTGVDCIVRAATIEWDAKGAANGSGAELVCQGNNIDLTSSEITGGYISTREYGKIKIKPRSGFGMTLFVTPDQQRRLKQLKKPK